MCMTALSWSKVPSALVNEPRLAIGIATPVSRSMTGEAEAMRATATATKDALQNMLKMDKGARDTGKAEL